MTAFLLALGILALLGVLAAAAAWLWRDARGVLDCLDESDTPSDPR